MKDSALVRLAEYSYSRHARSWGVELAGRERRSGLISSTQRRGDYASRLALRALPVQARIRLIRLWCAGLFRFGFLMPFTLKASRQLFLAFFFPLLFLLPLLKTLRPTTCHTVLLRAVKRSSHLTLPKPVERERPSSSALAEFSYQRGSRRLF